MAAVSLADPAVVHSEFAPAKVNLCLHVVGRRADGYHLLDSLVAFADPPLGDVLHVRFGPARTGGATLTVDGPFAAAVPTGADNVVLKAAALDPSIREIALTKNLPVAAGIGGGSADAAAVLRLMARHRGEPPTRYDAQALGLGADVPVCLCGRSMRMGGIGERLDPLVLPPLAMVLVNPGVPIATGATFAGLTCRDNPPLPEAGPITQVDDLLAYLSRTRNDLAEAARSIAPVVRTVEEALAAQEGCLFARMSGSGATVFGLFRADHEAASAVRVLRRQGWWVEAGRLARA